MTSRSRPRPGPATVTAAICSSKSVDALDIEATRRRLEQAGGGYEIVHESPGLEIGVYVLVAPEPDRQQPHADDEVYVVLEGRGVLEVEGEQIEVGEGRAAFVPAGADHRFTGYEGLSTLVVFSRPHDAA
jgi:mannose-6-phosphate isomerase-like protein (cupin superfamily)